MRVVDDNIWLNLAILFNPDPPDFGVSLHKESNTMSLAQRPTPRIFRREKGGGDTQTSPIVSSFQYTGKSLNPCLFMRHLRKGSATSLEKKTLPTFAGMVANAYRTQRMTKSSNMVEFLR